MAKKPYLHKNYDFDGSIKQGTYRVKGIVKLAEVYWRNDTVKKCVSTRLLKTLWAQDKEQKITLKNSQNTICFEIIFCSEISKDENLLFINNYLENFSKREKCEFLSRCATALSIVLRQDFERFYLDTIMEMGKIPHNFIVLYDDEKVADISSKKEQYKSNPEKFTLGPYRTLK
jgi:hypothetical protein